MTAESQKSDYINLLMNRVRSGLTAYVPDRNRKEAVERLFSRVASARDSNKLFYLLSHTREFGRLGKYLLYVSKKLDDKHVTFSNIGRNLSSDEEFLKKELLKFLDNPPTKEPVRFTALPVRQTDAGKIPGSENITLPTPADSDDIVIELDEEDSTSRIYMRLIQSNEHDEGKAYELPSNEKSSETAEEGTLNFDAAAEEQSAEEDQAFELPADEYVENVSSEDSGSEPAVEQEASKEKIVHVPQVPPDEGSFRIKRKLTFGFDEEESDLITGSRIETEPETASPEEKENDEAAEGKNKDEEVQERITISDEMSTEIDEYMRRSETEPFEPEDEAEEANEEFIEYESEVLKCNAYLSDEMTRFSARVFMTAEERSRRINELAEVSQLLEARSREMSFEIISNVYQAIYLSFERIAGGKYDISESTVALLKQGLELVEHLIRGEDYFVYKNTLKSIENIRRNLIEEKARKEEYAKRMRNKEQIQRELNTRYPSKEQRMAVNNILSHIRNIESVFRSVENTEGEYHTYESLRILSGCLNNFRSIAELALEIGLPELAQLSEASYNFVKYLCNYKKDPASAENKEIFDYAVYSLKSLLLGREVEDTDVFITYLNDPTRIYSKQKEINKPT
ncbi:MAG: hypothetical protein K1X85_10145 [Ignavibacteria bacterium]|nr:hypothetical protein [Ignavibacteria bacterium]